MRISKHVKTLDERLFETADMMCVWLHRLRPQSTASSGPASGCPCHHVFDYGPNCYGLLPEATRAQELVWASAATTSRSRYNSVGYRWEGDMMAQIANLRMFMITEFVFHWGPDGVA